MTRKILNPDVKILFMQPYKKRWRTRKNRRKSDNLSRERIFKHETDMPEPEPMKRDEILEQYQRAFTVINHRLFNDELPALIIDYPEGDLKERDELKDWKACFAYYADKKEPPEILLQFEDGPEWGISTDDIGSLCHELIHYFCYLHGIENTGPAPDYYHNLNFKKAAEDHGAKCSYRDDENGYCMAEWPPEVLEKIFDEL